MRPGARWVTLAVAVWLAANSVALYMLQQTPGPLALLHASRQGVSFAAPPDREMRVPLEHGVLDYSIPQIDESKVQRRLPAATGMDSGLADVRTAITWVRATLRIGEPTPLPQPWRMAALLESAQDTTKSFFCDTYARALVWTLQNMGYTARVVVIRSPNWSPDQGNHTTAGVYLPALQKWIWADATYDFIARSSGGTPLGLAEVSRTLGAGGSVTYERVLRRKDDDEELDDARRIALEPSLAAGNFVVLDGATTFGSSSRADRVLRFLRGQPLGIQLALHGQSGRDLEQRRLRAVLLAINGLALILVLAVAARSAFAQPARRSRSARR